MAEYAFLGVYRNEAGLTWERLRDPGCGMRATWGIFAVEWAVFLVLGWYLEQVGEGGGACGLGAYLVAGGAGVAWIRGADGAGCGCRRQRATVG